LHDWMSTVWSGEDSSTFPPLPGPPAMLTGSLLSVHHFFVRTKMWCCCLVKCVLLNTSGHSVSQEWHPSIFFFFYI
jgi:hypothetical protein